MTSVDNLHPDYTRRFPEWQLLRDSMRGEMAIKDGRDVYLPIPGGFAEQAERGERMYAAYLQRAKFPDIIRPTVGGIIGIIHRVPATITLPTALEHLVEKATLDGLSLDALHRLITNELLLMGRFGLLADVHQEGGDVYLAGYTAEAIVNWSEYFRDLYVLNESRLRRVGFAWQHHRRYRVLQLTEGLYQQAVFEHGPQDSVSAALPDAPAAKKTEELVQVGQFTPSTPKGAVLDFLPFVIVGSRDIRDVPDDPPMIGVARSAIAVYRLDADYRHQLFHSGQETLICTGIDKDSGPSVVGAGVVFVIPTPEGKAYYVGPSGVGIAAHRVAIADERLVAVSEGARLFTEGAGGRTGAESGEALKLRYSSEVSALVEIAQASAAGLAKALRFAAMLAGANPDEVKVEPNTKFLDVRMAPQEALALVQVWQSGAISYDTLYANLQEGEIASSDRDVDEEQDLIKQEAPPVVPGGGLLGIGGLPPPRGRPFGAPPPNAGNPAPT